MPPPKPTTTWEKFLWLLFPVPLLGGFVTIWFFSGRIGLLRCVPMGLSVLLLLFVVDNQYLAPFMTRVHFAIGSAVVTMVVVMEVSTLEAFFLKTVLRFLGTFFGAALAFSLAQLTGNQGNHPTLVVGISFVFFTVAKAVGSHVAKTNYFFTIASVTFALVFYTPSAAVGRFYSVLIGNMFAFLTTFCINMCFANPFDPQISSLASLVCNGGRIVGAALRAVDLAFLELHIASANKAEDVRAYLQSDAGELVQDFRREMHESLKGCESMSEALEILSDRASKSREEFEKTRYEAKLMNEQFKGDVELLRWFCCVQSGTLPEISELIAPADKVFDHATGLSNFAELHMNLGFHVLQQDELHRVDKVRVLIESVGPHFVHVFDPMFWLPRTRWKAMLVLMAPGLITSRVGKLRPINRGAAIEAMDKVSKTLVAADWELSQLWRETLARSPRTPPRASQRSDPAPANASEATSRASSVRHVQNIHLLYHSLHLVIMDLGMLAKTVLSLQEAEDLESCRLVRRHSEVASLIDSQQQAEHRLGGLTRKAGHRSTMAASTMAQYSDDDDDDEEDEDDSSADPKEEESPSAPEASQRFSVPGLQEEQLAGACVDPGEQAARSLLEAAGAAAESRAEEALDPPGGSAARAG